MLHYAIQDEDVFAIDLIHTQKHFAGTGISHIKYIATLDHGLAVVDGCLCTFKLDELSIVTRVTPSRDTLSAKVCWLNPRLVCVASKRKVSIYRYAASWLLVNVIRVDPCSMQSRFPSLALLSRSNGHPQRRSSSRHPNSTPWSI